MSAPVDPAEPRVAFMQDGSRLRFAVPVALHRLGLLDRMYTDWFVPDNSLWRRAFVAMVSKLKPTRGAQLAGRRHPELPARRVKTNLSLLTLKQKQRGQFASDVAYFEWESKRHAAWIEKVGIGQANAVMGFVRNIHPRLVRWARQHGLATVCDQIIAPAKMELAEAMIQRERHSGWEEEPLDESSYLAVHELEQATWDATHRLTCASDYVCDSLVEMGVAPERITTIPYPIDVQQFPMVDRANRTRPITVGFVGKVGLRKGAPYFMEVARRLASDQLRFVMIGPVGLGDTVVADYRSSVEFVGRVPLEQVRHWLAKFDMVLFPSTCEGSAGALMEAMATGLPIIASPNSGTVARDGHEGLVAPYDDIDRLASHVEALAIDPSRRLDMGRAARERVEGLDIDHYGQAVVNVLRSVRAVLDA